MLALDNMNKVFMNSLLSSDISAIKHNPGCAIWAITAMNETEIEDKIGENCLNGISTKPMSKD